MINPDAKIKYCPSCLGKDIIKKNHMGYTFYKGLVISDSFSNLCPECKEFLKSTDIPLSDWWVFENIECEPEFVFALDKLKKENLDEYKLKIQQFIKINQENLESEKHIQNNQQNIPKCPTCGSINIKKISGTKRFVSTGIFGLSSSNIGKTMECNNCGYKW